MFRARTGSLKGISGMAYHRRKLFAKLDRRLTADPCLRLKQLAHDLGVERHTIENIVRETKGKSFRKFQKGKLLRKALRVLMKESDKSIKEIAVALGYASSEPFSRFVKTHTGRNPTQIRKDPN